MKRRIEGGGPGGDQADMFGDHGERRQQGKWLEGSHGMAALQRLDRHVEHGEVVRHEKRIEPAAFQSLDETLDMREVEVGIRIRAGIAPGCGMDRCRPHECAEAELTFGGHGPEHPSGIGPIDAI